jgi:hypothetical protein
MTDDCATTLAIVGSDSGEAIAEVTSLPAPGDSRRWR